MSAAATSRARNSAVVRRRREVESRESVPSTTRRRNHVDQVCTQKKQPGERFHERVARRDRQAAPPAFAAQGDPAHDRDVVERPRSPPDTAGIATAGQITLFCHGIR